LDDVLSPLERLGQLACVGRVVTILKDQAKVESKRGTVGGQASDHCSWCKWLDQNWSDKAEG